MNDKITILHAYRAMLLLLNQYYFEFGQNELGAVLSDFQLLEDGHTADPAVWQDWLLAINQAILEEQPLLDFSIKEKELIGKLIDTGHLKHERAEQTAWWVSKIEPYPRLYFRNPFKIRLVSCSISPFGLFCWRVDRTRK